MTTRNNFDKSSSGINIEATVFYDTDRSRWDFENCFKILQHDGYRTNTIAYYIDHGNLPDDGIITFKLQGTPEQKTDCMKKEGYTDDDMPQPEDIDDYILDLYGEKITLLNYEDFNKVFAPLSVKPSKEIEKLITRGYSQGDYAEVLFCRDDIKETWGRLPRDGELQKIFDHLFWDSLVYACITIDGDEYPIWDSPDYDGYEWDREKFLSWVAKASGVPVDTLSPLVPDQPSWL